MEIFENKDNDQKSEDNQMEVENNENENETSNRNENLENQPQSTNNIDQKEGLDFSDETVIIKKTKYNFLMSWISSSEVLGGYMSSYYPHLY